MIKVYGGAWLLPWMVHLVKSLCVWNEKVHLSLLILFFVVGNQASRDLAPERAVAIQVPSDELMGTKTPEQNTMEVIIVSLHCNSYEFYLAPLCSKPPYLAEI